MPDGFRIAPVRTPEDLAATADLFAGYASSLPVDLAYQDFEGELAALPGKYAPPAGDLFLARDQDGAPLGCVGLRPLADDGCCEMKRLFLLPAARGLGLGRALTDAAVTRARQAGYRELRLDTLATMTAAQSLYGSIGFQRITPYYAPTPPGTVFMALRLAKTSPPTGV